jgi:hypothetical protein
MTSDSSVGTSVSQMDNEIHKSFSLLDALASHAATRFSRCLAPGCGGREWRSEMCRRKK